MSDNLCSAQYPKDNDLINMSPSPGSAAGRGRIAGRFIFRPRHFSPDSSNQYLLIENDCDDQARGAGNLRQAASDYSRALTFSAAAPRAHNGLGLINFAQGNYSTALKHFDLQYSFPACPGRKWQVREHRRF